MPWIPLVAAGIGAAGSIAGGLMSKGGSDDTADAMDRATAAQERMYKETQGYFAPYRESGAKALPYLEAEAFSPLGSSPSYTWKMQEQRKGLQNYLASRGLLESGAGILKDVDLTGRLTAEESEKKWGQQQYLSQMGLSAAGGTSTAAMQTGQGLANTSMTGGMGLANASAQQARDTASLYSNIGYMGAGVLSGYGKDQATLEMINKIYGQGQPQQYASLPYSQGSAGGYAEYAEGGRPPVGQPAIVGEQGPELFVPDQPGTIVPNKLMLSSDTMDMVTKAGKQASDALKMIDLHTKAMTDENRTNVPYHREQLKFWKTAYDWQKRHMDTLKGTGRA